MLKRLRDRIWQKIVERLNAESGEGEQCLCDFNALKREILQADVVLVEGRTNVSEVIKIVSLSPWTHAAIYIGRPVDIQNPAMRRLLDKHWQGDPQEPLLVESLLGRGTIVRPLSIYHNDHVRICRPTGLLKEDVGRVVNFAIEHLGTDYDVRQLLDLARLTFPYAILPRRWRSSLFQHNAGKPTHIVCSSMIARCFQQVGYPVLPVVHSVDDGDTVRFYKRNFRLFVPSDFDYSPYFDIVKFSFLGLARKAAYRRIEWIDEMHEARRSEKPDRAQGRKTAQVVSIAANRLSRLVPRRTKWSG